MLTARTSLSIRLQIDTKQRLNQMAAKRGTTASGEIKNAIDDHLRRFDAAKHLETCMKPSVFQEFEMIAKARGTTVEHQIALALGNHIAAARHASMAPRMVG